MSPAAKALSKRMYIRFVLQRSNDDSGAKDGFFSAAYELQKSADISAQSLSSINELLAWFESNLNTPERFGRTKSKGYYRRNTKGISWFKPVARDHISRARELKTLLEEHGYFVDELKTGRPGYVVFEDENQIVVEPFRDTGA